MGSRQCESLREDQGDLGWLLARELGRRFNHGLPSLVGGGRRIGHQPHRGLTVAPDPVEAGERSFGAFDALDEAEGPEFQQRGSAGERLANPSKQEHLGGAEEQKATPLATVGEQLHRIEQRRCKAIRGQSFRGAATSQGRFANEQRHRQ